jgi:hypothetical protein
MDELMRLTGGISPMWVIVCFETVVIILAMSVDFVAGFHKAKLRGEVRNSLGLKRTVSKFILYVGSVMISAGVDSIFFICGFWGIIRFAALSDVPVVTTVVSVFVCAVEIRSVWEKAERKQKRTALETAEAIVQLLGKETVGEKLNEVINGIKKKEDGTE